MIRERDNGAKKFLQQLRPARVRVGVMSDDGAKPKQGRSGGVAVDTVADVATMHEFGIGVPRRSFIADWADEALSAAQGRLRKAAQRIAKGGDEALELERFGLWAQGEIQKRMSKGIPPALSPVTIARKGADIPLIDTGQLRSSITYEVKRG
jgi:hypothetical protein